MHWYNSKNYFRIRKIIHTISLLQNSIFLVLATCFVSVFVNGQVESSESTSAQFLFNYYDQNGEHSAVTGGIGSEDLNVIASNIIVHLVPDTVKWYDFELGVDVITSASTDNIDFNVSSASRKDGRTHVLVGYGRYLKSNWLIGFNVSGSVESDYLSKGVGFSMKKKLNSMLSFSVIGQYYNDDLRRGWYLYGKGIELVYPVELRSIEWFDNHKRSSYSLSASWNQIVNKRLQFALIGDIVYQEGLLSTPFHRVFFEDQLTPNVELLPASRLKIPLAVRINYQTPLDLVVRSYYRFYTDDFGIVAHTANIELAISITYKMERLSILSILYAKCFNLFRTV